MLTPKNACAAVAAQPSAGGEAAPATGGTIPAGTPAWAYGLYQRLDTLQGTVDTLQGTANTLQGTVDTLQTTVDKLTHRTSGDRAFSLQQNRLAMIESHSLAAVPHPDTGLLPPPLLQSPTSVIELRNLTAPLIDSLLGFYGIQIQGTVGERRHRLAQELGCGHVA